MRVIPADDLLALVVGIDLVVDVNQAVLRECEIDAALPGMAGGQRMLHNDELLVVLIQTPLPDKDAPYLVLEVADRVHANAAISRLGHKDRDERREACIV